LSRADIQPILDKNEWSECISIKFPPWHPIKLIHHYIWIY